jgi:hypothetical protein
MMTTLIVPVRTMLLTAAIVAFGYSALAAAADPHHTTAIPIFSQIVVFELPNRFKPDHENSAQRSYIMEFVPEGQTVHAWTEMVTVQGFRDLSRNPRATPNAVLAFKAAQIQQVCSEHLIAQFLGDRRVDSYDAHAAIIGCARLPIDVVGAKAGQGELAYHLAIKGTDDVYVIQRALRGDAFDKDKAPISPTNAEDFMRALMPIKICDRSESKLECWARSPR